MKLLPLLPLALLFCSCQAISIADQPVLSKTAMSFDATGARNAECSLTGQIERGRSLTNASAAGGCATCN
jgi:hypothetical protein